MIFNLKGKKTSSTMNIQGIFHICGLAGEGRIYFFKHYHHRQLLNCLASWISKKPWCLSPRSILGKLVIWCLVSSLGGYLGCAVSLAWSSSLDVFFMSGIHFLYKIAVVCLNIKGISYCYEILTC